jgi:hypothetical protein
MNSSDEFVRLASETKPTNSNQDNQPTETNQATQLINQLNSTNRLKLTNSSTLPSTGIRI